MDSRRRVDQLGTAHEASLSLGRADLQNGICYAFIGYALYKPS